MRKLAIVGGHPLTRSDAPYHDSDFDIWGLTIGPNQPWFERCDAVIEIHRSALYLTHPNDPGYWDFLQNTDADVWMYDIRDDVKNRKTFPLAEIQNELLSGITIEGEPVLNFDSSGDYALALAILKGYKHVALYGIELDHDFEKHENRVSYAFWVGFAAGRGIAIDLKSGGHMFNRRLYGRNVFGEDTMGFLKIER